MQPLLKYSRRDQADVSRRSTSGNGRVSQSHLEQDAVLAIETTITGLQVGNTARNGGIFGVVRARGNDLTTDNESRLVVEQLDLKATLKGEKSKSISQFLFRSLARINLICSVAAT